MINGQKMDVEKRMAHAFDSGFENAARALAQMTKNNVSYHGFHSETCQLSTPYLVHDAYKQHNEGSRILLTTEIFGNLTGKSYLFLSPGDYEIVTHSIPHITSSINPKEEFLKELDNILSAAVITKISNTLNSKMFGDIPILVGETKSQLEDIINDDFHEQADELFVSSASFTFEKHPTVHLLFLWVVDYSKIVVQPVKQV